MKKKSVLGLILFTCIVIAGLFFGTMIMIRQPVGPDYVQNPQMNDSGNSNEDSITENQDQSLGEESYTDASNGNRQEDTADNLLADNKAAQNEAAPDTSQNEGSDEAQSNDLSGENSSHDSSSKETDQKEQNEASGDPVSGDSDLFGNDKDGQKTGTDNNSKITDNKDSNGKKSDSADEDADSQDETEVALGGKIIELPDMQLITDCTKIDYMKYIPEMVYDSKIEAALDIDNPDLAIKAKSAILFDVNTRKVLYYKDPVEPVFPASTAKLLTALVALDWCIEEEEVTVGDELDLVAPDSTTARLKKGQILTIRNLIEGMLVPSGNDAAYVTAAYVGRKSLKNSNASLKDAIFEFIRLMNNKAKSLGAINSCFKTPDGYDAIGQYTTAYDMGMIGLAAADNEIILDVCNKTTARNVFADGHDVTWNSTNSLIKKDSSRYYPYCIGLKTGTSTMAGKCLISLAKNGGREVLSVVMNSDSDGRWDDSTKLLDYGLGR